jgi:tripartite-type tricarboxylate transporter receptor subunit TctC
MRERRHANAMIAGAAALAIWAAAPPIIPARAQTVADTFRGKTIRMLLPTLPGGGRSLYALPFAGYFGKHIPGNPTVLPVFMPGAGGLIAVNNAYGVAAPDGLTIVSPLASVVTAQALGDEAVKYDAGKLNWIGRITDATRIFFVSGRITAKVLADFRSHEVVIGSSGRGSETYLNPAFMNKIFGTKLKIVTGYQSAGAMNMAVERGETEGAFSTWNDVGSYHPDWLPDGKIRIVLQIGLAKHPALADVPLLLDLAESEADRELVAFMSSDSQMGQSYAAPPGVPAPIVAALRQAFDETMQDPGFMETMRAAKVQFNPMGGEELARSVEATLGAPRAVIERYKAALADE